MGDDQVPHSNGRITILITRFFGQTITVSKALMELHLIMMSLEVSQVVYMGSSKNMGATIHWFPMFSHW